MANITWTMNFPNTDVYHLPRFNIDHLPILLRTNPRPRKLRKQFRCENWWLLNEDFKDVCHKTVQGTNLNWYQTAKQFKREVNTWVKKSNTPQAMLKKVESEMLSINSSESSIENRKVENELLRQHESFLLMQEYYWHKKLRVNWAMFGDRNSRFFHVSAITRKHRNTIRAIMDSRGNWVTDEKQMRQVFVIHFRGIYNSTATHSMSQVYSQELLTNLSQIPYFMKTCAGHLHMKKCIRLSLGWAPTRRRGQTVSMPR